MKIVTPSDVKFLDILTKHRDLSEASTRARDCSP